LINGEVVEAVGVSGDSPQVDEDIEIASAKGNPIPQVIA